MEKNFAKAHDFFTKSHVFFDEKSRLINVLLVRSGILCFIAMGARMFIFSNGHEFIKMRFNGVLDHVACLIALFVLIAFHLSVFLKYPGAWFWSKNGLSEKAKNWFLLDVFHVFPDSSTLQESWNEICDRESFMGIDLSVSKKNLVFLWEKDMEKSEKKTPISQEFPQSQKPINP